jgi:dUTP pyrophosphatase
MVQQKSGLASDFGINTIGNIIDSGYRGEIHAVIVNHGREPLSIVPGQKIAQLLFLRVGVAPIEYVEELNGTARGTGGFGSTK